MDEIFPIAGVVSTADEEAVAMDEWEFELLYAATARPILAYLIGVTGRRDVADDVLQETYCRFLVRQPAPMDENETRRYLFRIATNLLRDRWRTLGASVQVAVERRIYRHGRLISTHDF